MSTQFEPSGHADASFSHALVITGSRSWDDEAEMKRAFQDIWLTWGAQNVTRPVLLSGNCPRGADAMAEALWESEGFDIIRMPADWSADGRAAGMIRNQKMINRILQLREVGTVIRCAAFLDLCRKCDQRTAEAQLMPDTPGHFSHGTVHARSLALAAGIETDSVIHPSLPPF